MPRSEQAIYCISGMYIILTCFRKCLDMPTGVNCEASNNALQRFLLQDFFSRIYVLYVFVSFYE